MYPEMQVKIREALTLPKIVLHLYLTEQSCPKSTIKGALKSIEDICSKYLQLE